MTPQHKVMSVVGFGLLLLVLGFIYDDQPKPGPTPLAERCSELGGEWLYKSADLLCLLPGGDKLSYHPASDTFEPYVSSGGLVPVAQASTGEKVAVDTCTQEPEFADYAANQSFAGRPKVDFTTNEAAGRYRTAITKDVARGVNFAGKYVVSTWGCGEGCQGSAVIDAETGAIVEYGLESNRFAFEDNSRLLDAGREGYYVLSDERLKPLCE